MFIILAISADGCGAKYWYSTSMSAISPNSDNEMVAMSPWPDVIVGILAYWVGISFPLLASSLKYVH